jgi:hypothetical protein
MSGTDNPQSAHPASAPVAGWYADPDGVADRLRYWDGSRWTSHFHPPAAAPAHAAGSGAARKQARSLTPFAVAAVAGLVLACVTEVLTIKAGTDARGIIGDMLAGRGVTLEDVNRVDGQIDSVTRTGYISFAIGIFTFIPWFFVARANLDRFRVKGTRYGAGWAIAGWFIPIAALFIPKQVADDILRGSRAAAARQASVTAASVPGYVHLWWALWLGSIAANVGSHIMVRVAEDRVILSQGDAFGVLGSVYDAMTVALVACALSLGAALFAILMVFRVTSTQEEAADGPVQTAEHQPRQQATSTPISVPQPVSSGTSQSPPGWTGPL